MQPGYDLHKSVLVGSRIDPIDIFLQRSSPLGVQPCGVKSLLVEVGDLLLDRSLRRLEGPHLGEQVIEPLHIILPQLIK